MTATPRPRPRPRPRATPRPRRPPRPLSALPFTLVLAAALALAAADDANVTTTGTHNPFAFFLRPESLIGAGRRERIPPTAKPHTFTDRSAYVRLASSGALLATGDFNRDRFTDLLVLDAKSLRAASVLLWDHDTYSFRHAGAPIRLDDPALQAVETAAGLRPLSKIAGAHVADFGNDGALDVLLYDGAQARVFFGSANGSFVAAPPAVIPDLPAASALIDADADLVPDVLAVHPNGTRTVWQYARNVSVLDDVSNQTGKFEPRAWPAGRTAAPGGSPCKTEAGMAPALAFADMDGDCLPDVVIPTSCGLEVWTAAARAGRPLWKVSAPRDVKRLGLDVFNYAHGDRAIAIADFDRDGTLDLAVANRNRADLLVHLNRQTRRAVGALCTRDEGWKLERQIGVASGLSLRPGRVGSLFSGIEVPPLLHVGDYDLDGMPDLLYIDGSSGTPAILRNRARWGGGDDANFEALPSNLHDGLAQAGGSAVSATFFDTDESGRQDVVVVTTGNDTRLVWNSVREGWDALFFKGTMLSALGYRLEPRPFAPVVGNTIKLSYMERGTRSRIRHTCSQCSQSGAFQLAPCNCQFGLEGIANYIEELWAGAGALSRSWTNRMPNSIAVIWADAENAPSSWFMEYFTQRNRVQMLRVTGILMTVLLVLGAIILWLQHKETKEDREQDERESARLFNFVV